jgi:hypothetical protein
MIRIALMSTADRSPDLTRMTDHLYTTLEQIEKVEVVRVDLLPGQPVVYGNYAYIVFCGYDHAVLSHLHAAMAVTDPQSTRIILYDEPGASPQFELNSLMFRGVDSARLPAHSVTRLIFSWTYRDVLIMAQNDPLRLKDDTGSAKAASRPKSAKSDSRNVERSARARQVEDSGESQT